MIRRIRLALLIISFVVLQTTFISDLRVAGSTPSLLLVATLAVAYEDGADSGVVFGFVGGLAIDCFLSTPFGVSALTFALTGWALGVLQTGLVREMRFVSALIAVAGGVLGGSLFVVIASVAGSDHLLTGRSLRIILLAAVFDAIIAPVVFPIVRWAAREPNGAASWTR